MNKLNSVNKKLTFWRVLKVIAYLAGYPLMLYFMKESVEEISGGFINNPYLALLVALAGFALLAIAQIIVARTLREKPYLVRAVVVIIIAMVMVLAPLSYIRFGVENKFADLKTEYEKEYDMEIDGFGKQVFKYQEHYDDHVRDLGRFLDLYNIGYDSANKSGSNGDTTPTFYVPKQGEEAEKEVPFLNGFGGLPHYAFGLEQGDAYYSINGMYADGYIFGYAQAKYIMQTYYGLREKYKDIDGMLETELKKLDTNANSLWNQYKKTTDYLRAYGNAPMTGTLTIDGEEYDEELLYAKYYYLDWDDVLEIVDVLISELKAVEGMKPLLSSAKNVLGSFLGDMVSLLDLDNLTVGALLETLEGFGLGEEDVKALLADLSFYYSPTAYPQMYFIENEEIRDYAYAKYYGIKHGAIVGSVLLTESENGKVGEITMSQSGHAPMSQSEVLDLFERIDAEEDYMNVLYPWLAVREYLIIFLSVVPAALALAYYFADREKKEFAKLIKEGR